MGEGLRLVGSVTAAWAHEMGDDRARVSGRISGLAGSGFTLSNAGSRYFEDRSDLSRLGDVDWDAVAARNWSACREAKQAEFLLEHSFPWHLVERIGVLSQPIATQVAQTLPVGGHRPPVQILPAWYY